MKTAAVLSIAAVALAAPAPIPQSYDSTTPTPFSGISTHSASPIHLLPVNANGRQIWLGKDTSIYCPEGQVDCSKSVKDTVFVSNNGALSLDVVVPGGQQAYITPEGQLKYTGAHSAFKEEGSIVTGFKEADGYLQFEDNDWYACPSDDAYKVYAISKSTGEGCTGFRFVTGGRTNFTAAWSYT